MDAKWGYIDVEGKQVIDFKYDRAEDFVFLEDEPEKKTKSKEEKKQKPAKGKIAARVTLDGKGFYIDKTGNCIKDCN